MPNRRAAFSAVLCLALMCGSNVWAQTQSPSEMYREFAAAARQATSLAQVERFLSAGLLKDMKAAPKAQQENWLKFMKPTWSLSDFKLSSESVQGDKATLEANGKTAAGKTAKGRIELVRERGTWKLEDEAWATDP